MKRDRALVAFCAVFLILFMNPWPSYAPASIVTEPQSTKDFGLSADGDESGESLTVFAETLSDNTMMYPDRFANETVAVVASSGEYGGTATEGGGRDWTDTQTKDGYWWWVATAGTWEMTLWFDHSHGEELDGFNYACYVAAGGALTDTDLKAWDHVASAWDVIQSTPDESGVWWNGSVNAHEYWNTTHIGLQYCGTAPAASGQIWDYAEISDFYYMTLADSDHYGESFSSVSDWTTSDTSISTDGDVATITENGASDWGRAYKTISATGVDIRDLYYEVSATVESGGGWKLQFYNPVASWWYDFFYSSTSGTKKGRCGSNVHSYNVTRIAIWIGGEGKWVKPDYFRIGPSDEMGWQHDCSTTAGVTDSAGGSISSDGDELTLTADSDGSVFDFVIDITATAAYLDADYYPMIGLDFNDADSADYIKVESYDGAAWATVIANTTVGTATHYANCRAADADIEKFRISVNPSANPRLKWFKAYSIANHTLTQSGAGTDDYLYVDSGVLYSSIDDGYIELNHDPALSVSDTYPVYNLTTSGTAPEFSQYVSEWSAYSDETRGATTSGTVTDIKLKFDGTEILSAIKFIEDGTAPDIIDKFIGPPEPDDSEAVTITAVTYDAVEVYEVTINAVVYPTGFSDVDYDATEQTTDVLWSYEFSTLTAGYYLFQITASDGANTYSEYIPVTVRESAIEVITYTLFGAGSDFTYMQYSFWISHDCTFIIEEWSTTWAKNETHSGSVVRGDRNIAWDKIGVNDVDANYTITFTNGSLTKVIDGGYITAYKALQVTEIDFVNIEQSDNWATNLTINFYTNKEVDWYVYDCDNDDAVLHSGTTTEGDGFITWVKNNARGAHRFAVKWEDGISEQWYNNSYWIYERNIDDLPGGADPGADQRRTIEFWATLGAFAGIFGILVIFFKFAGLDEKIKNLPNYRTQERGKR